MNLKEWGNRQEFRPSGAMCLYAFARARLGNKASDASISDKIGVAAETISRWKRVKGFEEWLEAQISHYRTPIHDLLEQVALDKLHEFKYWEAIAKKYGYISQDQNQINQNQQVTLVPAMTKEQAEALLETIRSKQSDVPKSS